MTKDENNRAMLTELQSILIKFLNSMGISLEVVFPVMLYLETEEEQAEFAMWLLSKWEHGISEGEIVNKISEILNNGDAIRDTQEIG